MCIRDRDWSGACARSATDRSESPYQDVPARGFPYAYRHGYEPGSALPPAFYMDERVQDLLIQNQITGGHARALLSVEDGQLQYELAGKIIAENLSVRETEKLVKSLSKKKNPKEKKVEDESLTLIFRDLEERMKSAMGTKVSINRKDKNKGRVEIEYYSESELERIVELIESIR